MAQQFYTGSTPNLGVQPDKPYVHQPYPSYRWHKDGATRLVQNADEDAALGDGWADTPFPCHPESNRYVAPAGKIMRSEDLKIEANIQRSAESALASPALTAYMNAAETTTDFIRAIEAKPAPKKRGRKPKVKPEGV